MASAAFVKKAHAVKRTYSLCCSATLCKKVKHKKIVHLNIFDFMSNSAARSYCSSATAVKKSNSRQIEVIFFHKIKNPISYSFNQSPVENSKVKEREGRKQPVITFERLKLLNQLTYRRL